MNLLFVNLELCYAILMCYYGYKGSFDVKFSVSATNYHALMRIQMIYFTALISALIQGEFSFCFLPLTIIALFSAFFPHMSMRSRFLQDDINISNFTRDWSNVLVYSSFVFAIPSFLSFWSGEYMFAFLELCTCIASTLYHLHLETAYFNMDNIFASSLLALFVYTLYDSYFITEDFLYFYVGIVGMPVCGFLIVSCGLPAEVEVKTDFLGEVEPENKLDRDILSSEVRELNEKLRSPSSSWEETFHAEGGMSTANIGNARNYLTRWLCCRNDTMFIRIPREGYIFTHTVWHLAAACGPTVVTLYARKYYLLNNGLLDSSNGFMNSGYFDSNTRCLPILPIASLIVGIVLNLVANFYGVFPPD